MGLSTHILDTHLGRPAANVGLVLYKSADTGWEEIGSGMTDADGRCRTLLGEQPLEAATYKLRFSTGDYFTRNQLTGLYPFVEIVFLVRNPAEHFHIPLLLTANGYSTYRGS